MNDHPITQEGMNVLDKIGTEAVGYMTAPEALVIAIDWIIRLPDEPQREPEE